MGEIVIAIGLVILIFAAFFLVNVLTRSLEEKHRQMLSDLHEGLTKQGDRLGGHLNELRESVAAKLDARLDQLATPTLAAGESVADLRAEAFDPEEAARRGMAFEALDQLALEHLYGIRG